MGRLKDRFLELIEIAKNARGPAKLALNEQWKAFQVYVGNVVVAIEQSAAVEILTSLEKKAEALEAAALFYDNYIEKFDLPYVPNIIEPLVDRYIKKVFLILASGSIDATVATLRQFNVIKKKEVQ